MRGVCIFVRMERISNNAFGLTEVDAMEMMEAGRLVGGGAIGRCSFIRCWFSVILLHLKDSFCFNAADSFCVTGERKHFLSLFCLSTFCFNGELKCLHRFLKKWNHFPILYVRMCTTTPALFWFKCLLWAFKRPTQAMGIKCLNYFFF